MGATRKRGPHHIRRPVPDLLDDVHRRLDDLAPVAELKLRYALADALYELEREDRR